MSVKLKQCWIYCTTCRQYFRVKARPRPDQRVRCICGLEGSVEHEFHVFDSEKLAKEFAETHRDLMREVKDTLRSEGVSLADSRVEVDKKDQALAQFHEDERQLLDAVEQSSDELTKHEALNVLIEFYDAHLEKFPEARDKCIETCREDIILAPTLIQRAKQDRGMTRFRFIAFRRLARIYETAGSIEHAIAVCDRASALGLPGYADRARELREMLGH